MAETTSWLPNMMEKIKALEATVNEQDTQLLQQQQELSMFQASKRRRLYGLNDVKTVGTRLHAMRESHAKFCTKYAGGKTTPKTLPARTRLLEFTDRMIAQFEKEFQDHLEAIEAEPAPKKKKST